MVDAGYEGAIGALMDVLSPHGVVLYKNISLGQVAFTKLTEIGQGYNGVYQGSRSCAGRDRAST